MKAANEAAAIKTLRTIAEQQMLFYNSHQRSTFGTFDEMLKENMLDKRFEGTTPVVEGYIFNLRVIPKSTTTQPGYAVNSDPQVTEGVGATERTTSISTQTATRSTSIQLSRRLSPIRRSEGKY